MFRPAGHCLQGLPTVGRHTSAGNSKSSIFHKVQIYKKLEFIIWFGIDDYTHGITDYNHLAPIWSDLGQITVIL